jgi:hypothetical protein
MRHLNIRENAVHEAQRLQEVSVSHISGKRNPAEIFTKEFKSDSTFRSLRDLLLFSSSVFSCFSLAWGVLGLFEISNSKLEFRNPMLCKESRAFCLSLLVFVWFKKKLVISKFIQKFILTATSYIKLKFFIIFLTFSKYSWQLMSGVCLRL